MQHISGVCSKTCHCRGKIHPSSFKSKSRSRYLTLSLISVNSWSRWSSDWRLSGGSCSCIHTHAHAHAHCAALLIELTRSFFKVWFSSRLCVSLTCRGNLYFPLFFLNRNTVSHDWKSFPVQDSALAQHLSQCIPCSAAWAQSFPLSNEEGFVLLI